MSTPFQIQIFIVIIALINMKHNKFLEHDYPVRRVGTGKRATEDGRPYVMKTVQYKIAILPSLQALKRKS